MTLTVVLLVAGILGVAFDGRFAWGLVGVWALLTLIGVAPR